MEWETNLFDEASRNLRQVFEERYDKRVLGKEEAILGVENLACV